MSENRLTGYTYENGELTEGLNNTLHLSPLYIFEQLHVVFLAIGRRTTFRDMQGISNLTNIPITGTPHHHHHKLETVLLVEVSKPMKPLSHHIYQLIFIK